MIKKSTLAGIIVFMALLLSNSQALFSGNGPLKSILAAVDTIMYDSCLKSRVYGFPPYTLTNNVPAKTIIYSSSDTTVVSIKGNIATIKGAGNCNITAMVQGDTTTKVTKKQTIYKKTLNISTPNLWRAYKTANPKFVLVYDGFVPGEDETVIDFKPVTFCSANINSAPGKYSILISGGSDDNYALYVTNGTLTIAGAALNDENDAKELYPNPAKDIVNITGTTKPVTAVISNMVGVTVKNILVENGTFSVSDLPKGLYLVKIIDGAETTVKKLLVE